MRARPSPWRTGSGSWMPDGAPAPGSRCPSGRAALTTPRPPAIHAAIHDVRRSRSAPSGSSPGPVGAARHALASTSRTSRSPAGTPSCRAPTTCRATRRRPSTTTSTAVRSSRGSRRSVRSEGAGARLGGHRGQQHVEGVGDRVGGLGRHGVRTYRRCRGPGTITAPRGLDPVPHRARPRSGAFQAPPCPEVGRARGRPSWAGRPRSDPARVEVYLAPSSMLVTVKELSILTVASVPSAFVMCAS